MKSKRSAQTTVKDNRNMATKQAKLSFYHFN